MTLPADDPVFPAARWRPRPRPGDPAPPGRIVRRAAAATGGTDGAAGGTGSAGGTGRSSIGGEGPRVLSCDGDTALVRFRHAARSASAVALQANGWWRPEPRDACDLRPTGDGWWEGTFEVPSDWRATYGYVEHSGDGEPPWWEAGLKAPGAPVVSDLSNPRRHRAARGGALRTVVSVPDDGPFTPGLVTDREASPLVHTLATGADEPTTRGWAARPGDPGCEDLDLAEPLPLLIVTDGLQHVDQLGTPARLRRGIAAGLLPPLAAVFVESGPDRAEVLGVPGGHARWIAEQLVPRLRQEGLADGIGPVTLTEEAERTVVTGSSFGGLTALFAVARAPQLIGTAIAQSVSLWRYEEGALVEPLRRAAARHPLRLRLHAGRYEGTLPARAAALVSALSARPGGSGRLDVDLALHSGGHDWAWWQPALLRELSALLG